jgi:uncharacterized membrane protein (UPF0182 family)
VRLESLSLVVYFGENVPDYSIIGGVKTDTPVEFDYPDDTSANGQRNYTYTGTGGVPVGSLLNKVVFALKYQEQTNCSLKLDQQGFKDPF